MNGVFYVMTIHAKWYGWKTYLLLETWLFFMIMDLKKCWWGSGSEMRHSILNPPGYLYIWVEWSHEFMCVSFGLDSKWFRLMYTLTLTTSSQLSILFPINTCYALLSHWYFEWNNLVSSFSKEMEGDRMGEGTSYAHADHHGVASLLFVCFTLCFKYKIPSYEFIGSWWNSVY